MTSTTLAVAVADPSDAETWLGALRRALPECDVRMLAGLPPERVDYAAVWGRVDGLAHLANLKAILSLGAGVDHILANPSLGGVPVVRMIDPGLTQGMREYVLLHVLRHHRRTTELEEQQRRRVWNAFQPPLARDRQVGILGMGELGRDAARHLAVIGFQVAGWSRRRHRVRGVRSFAGTEELPEFLAASEILVCLLPLTPETRGILDRHLFAHLPHGAAIINAARGGHLVEADLVAALESGQVAGATLDVFATEPLPADHPFWTHPRITVTPHNASLTDFKTGAAAVAEAVRRLMAGKKPKGLVDRRAGY